MLHERRLSTLAVLALALAGCGKGTSSPDGGPDGGGQACSTRAPPRSSDGAPKRIATPAPLPLPSGRSFSSSPLLAHAGSDTVALFPVENGVGAATGAGAPFSGAFLLADQADSPALVSLGSRFFVGYRQGGALFVGVADGAQGVVQLGAGKGRTLQVPLPAGGSDAGQLALAATPGGEVVAAFTVTVAAGGRTSVYLARLQNAGCAACTLAFDAAVPAGPQSGSEQFPRVAAGPAGALAVAFIRPGARAPSAEAWISQGTAGAAITMRPLLVDALAAEEPATPAFYSDGSLAYVYGRLRGEPLADGGTTEAPEVAGVVARHLSQNNLGTPVLVNDDDPAADSTHWLPGAAVDAYDRLWVAFYDTRFAAPGDAAWGPGPAEPARAGACTAVVMLARSDDKGGQFKPDALVTPDTTSLPFDAVPGSLHRLRAPLGPVTVSASASELFVGYSDVLGGTGRAALAEGSLP